MGGTTAHLLQVNLIKILKIEHIFIDENVTQVYFYILINITVQEYVIIVIIAGNADYYGIHTLSYVVRLPIPGLFSNVCE